MTPTPSSGVPPIHLVTDDEVLARPDFARWLGPLMEVGGERLALHLRGPRTGGRRLVDVAEAALRARQESAAGGWVVVNDRLDVALAVGADGVQLGARSLSLEVTRRVAPGLLLGVSMHHPNEARRLAAADWLLGGTIWATPSHPGEAGGGVRHLAALVAAAPSPLIAIGGVTPERVGEARKAGARGVAVLRGIWAATDPVAALSRYLSAWSE